MIIDVVQRHGDGAAVWQRAGAGQAQRLHSLLSIENVILADGMNGKFRWVTAQRNAVCGAAGIAHGIGNGNRNVVVAFSQQAHHGRRHPHAPAAVRLHHTGEGLTANGYAHDIPCCGAARRTGNNLRLALLAGIEDIVVSNGVNRHDRGGGIHGEIDGR